MLLSTPITTIWVKQEVIRKIFDEAEKWYPYETGGCLIGYIVDSFQQFVIEDCIGPGPEAKHSINYFKPDSKWQENEIERIYLESGRLKVYLGDWHVHPKGNLELSRKDKQTLLKISKFPLARLPYPIMLLIAGPPGTFKIWKFERASLFRIVASECRTKEYKE